MAITWVSSFYKVPWRFQLYFNEIKLILSSLRIKFQHVGQMVNSFVDGLAKQGVDLMDLQICWLSLSGFCSFGLSLLYHWSFPIVVIGRALLSL